jgi:phage shock protein A
MELQKKFSIAVHEKCIVEKQVELTVKEKSEAEGKVDKSLKQKSKVEVRAEKALKDKEEGESNVGIALKEKDEVECLTEKIQAIVHNLFKEVLEVPLVVEATIEEHISSSRDSKTRSSSWNCAHCQGHC